MIASRSEILSPPCMTIKTGKRTLANIGVATPVFRMIINKVPKIDDTQFAVIHF